LLAADAWPRSRSWRKTAWILALVVGFLPTEKMATLARTGGQSGAPGYDPEFRALCAWAHKDTPRGALFAFPSNAFRYYASRPITGCTEDGGTLILTGSADLVPWLRSEKQRRTLHDENDTAGWFGHARKHGAGYAVVPAWWPASDAPAAFTNQRYRAYRLAD
jgi:hypothetical protein